MGAEQMMIVSSGTAGRGLRAAAWVALAWAAAPVGGCTPTEPTEIVAGVTTQIQVPKLLKTVGVTLQKGGRLSFCESYAVHDGSVTLPSTLGMTEAEGADAVAGPLTVQVLGFRTVQPGFAADCVATPVHGDDAEVLVIRRQRLPFAAERIVYLPMPLRESCTDVACDADQSCVAGKCEDLSVDPAALADYRDDLVFGDTDTCFSVSSCMPPWGMAPALVTDDASCTFRTPWPDGTALPAWGQLNVAVVYSSLGTEVLDLDPREGFTLPDPADPLAFRLAPNLCETGYHAGHIVAVAASALCPSKRPLQPVCTDELRALQAGSDPLGLAPAGSCLLPAPLTQAESALYVLMDRSAPMAEYFGPEGLQFVLETTLKNPVAARTLVGFGWLPADQSQCTAPLPNAFATPVIGFGDVATVRGPIGEAIGDSTNLLPGAPQLELDAVLSPDGAYGALDGLTPQISQRFNRRALLLLGNRDLLGSCFGPGPVAPSAGEALTNGIHTYVVVLDAPPGTQQLGDPVADGGAIASAGGTELFDAVTDKAVGAKAVQDIVSDLGSCLYDAPDLSGVQGSPTTLPASATLTYVDPLTLSRTDIAHDAGCSEGSSAGGWNQSTEGVRICGFDCQQLRDTLTAAALAAGQNQQPAPHLPLLVSLPCSEIGL